MEKFDEVDLVNESVRYSTDYTNKTFHSDNKVDFSIMLNTGAHGYYMGYRYAESFYREGFLSKFLNRNIPIDVDKLRDQSQDASKKYLSEKNLTHLEEASRTLVKLSVARGFRDGFRKYESRVS